MNHKGESSRSILAKDKRVSDRLMLPVTIYYCLPPDESWNGPYAIDDISGHGLKFSTHNRIDNDKEIKLKLLIGREGHPIVVKGMVIWCKKNTLHDTNLLTYYEIGIKFSKMNHADRKHFVQYISEEILLKYLKSNGIQ